MAERTRIVILGGGFGGAYLAKALTRRLGLSEAEVIIIDRNNYFIFYPLLVEAGCGSIEPRHCTVPIREFAPKAELLMAEITGLDLDGKRVRVECCGKGAEDWVEFDHLVVALGSVTRILPEHICSGVKEHAFFMKTMGDAIVLRDRAIEALELANATDDPDEKKRLLHFVVVGGNVTGIEVVGELETFVREACALYHNVSESDCTFTVYELAPEILGIVPEHLRNWAAKALTRRGIRLKTGISVKEVHADHVVQSDDEVVPCSTVIWTAGIAPNPLLKELDGLPLNKFGGLECTGDYRAAGLDHVWGLGDNAAVPGPDGKPMPPLAQIAIRQAPQLADNIAASIQGGSLKQGHVGVQGILVPLGRHRGIASIKGIKIHGILAWMMWRGIYLMKTPRLGRRIRVALDWFIDLFCRRDFVQLGLSPKSRRELGHQKVESESAQEHH
ncbi:MAG: NAD(P)/FAD-dependent oxidoreductase [Phycisphaerales bacterium]|nr:NAD(P)/FAD-dependent oxidoreductase [Phycisphaerales bacterium]